MMERDRIVQPGTDACFGQVAPEIIATLRCDDVEVRSSVFLIICGTSDGEFPESLVVPLRALSPSDHLFFEAGQEGQEHGSVDLVKTAVSCRTRADASIVPSEATNASCPVGDGSFGDSDETTVSGASKGLGRIEAERRGITDRPSRLVCDACPNGLRAILDKSQRMGVRQLPQSESRAGPAIQVYEKDCSRGGTYGRFDREGIKHAGPLVHLNEYGRCTRRDDSHGGSMGSERWHDHLITRAYAQGKESDRYSVGPITDTDSMGLADSLAEALLELLQFWSEDVVPGANHPLPGFEENL